MTTDVDEVRRRTWLAGGVATPLRTVLDCARTLPFPEALAVADSARRRQLVTEEELPIRADETRGAGRQAVLRVAQHASPDAADPFESALRGIALDARPDRLPSAGRGGGAQRSGPSGPGGPGPAARH